MGIAEALSLHVHTFRIKLQYEEVSAGELSAYSRIIVDAIISL